MRIVRTEPNWLSSSGFIPLRVAMR
uniref:Heat shock protein 90 n=1 Tax=Rhizophora mucronata TaxID=61149 RepID=A0A2P2PT95_RHIMU